MCSDSRSPSPVSFVHPSTTSPLPIEVWERAIDWLVADYTPNTGQTYENNFNLQRDLLNCALVCRAWRIRSQMHLFAFLRISGSGLSRYESLVLKSPTLCEFAKELKFFNKYIEETETKIAERTIETASHAVRITHKLSQVHYLMVDRINLAIEHPHFPKHMAALSHINQLDFSSPTPTRLSQLARMLVGLRNLSTLYLEVPIIADPDSIPLPNPCYSAKSCLTRLDLDVRPGGHLLLGWLAKAKSFTKLLQVLDVTLEDQTLSSDVIVIMQALQSLLVTCAGHLEEWHFWAKLQPDDSTVLPGVSLASHKSLSKLYFRVSKVWFRHALEQLKSVTSKYVAEILFWYWVDEHEQPFDDLWTELDVVLSTDIFKLLMSVEVGCVYRDGNYDWYTVDDFDESEFPGLLPTVFKRGVLMW